MIIIMMLVAISFSANAGDNNSKTTLVIIDVQNFYFPGGVLALDNSEETSLNAKKILDKFRESGLLVVHVRHNSENGGEIHESVTPLKDEKVFSKDEVNCFKDTDLLSYLKEHEIEKLVIVGMQTHMCVEAAVRAGHDLGFECVLVHDACATRDLKFNEEIIPAEQVHRSTLSTLSRTYAKVVDTKTFLETF